MCLKMVYEPNSWQFMAREKFSDQPGGESHIHILYPRGTCIVEWFAVVSLPQSGMAIRIWGTNSWRRKTGASWRPVVLKRISRLWSRGGRVHQGASTIDILDKDGIRWFEMVWDGLKWYKMVWDGLRSFKVVWDGLRWFEMVWDPLRWFEMV